LPAAFISQLPLFKPLDLGKMDQMCNNCGAKHWRGELPSNCTLTNKFWTSCCNAGKSQVDLLKEPPEYIKKLYTEEDEQGKAFRENIRRMNVIFAFTSISCNQTELSQNYSNNTSSNSSRTSTYFTPFQIQGEMYHIQGPLEAENQTGTPKYAQLYIYDPLYASQMRSIRNDDVDKELILKLSEIITECNPFVSLYRSAYDTLKANNTITSVRITPSMTIELVEGRDKRTENLPTSTEVSGIVPTSSNCDYRDIRIYLREGDQNSYSQINQNHTLYMPLHYVLLFPMGDKGWCREMTSKSVIDGVEKIESLHQRAFYRFRLHQRDTEFPTIFLAKRLFQQFLVDAWAVCEQNKLSWIKSHQNEIRADLYNGFQDALIQGDLDFSSVGKRCILPSSFVGGPRFMARLYQDSMAIVRQLGKPTLFITFTANPRWEEITRELYPGQTSVDRPDLVARVFNLKVRELIHDLKNKQIFGKYKGLVRTIEYQKRGLPHLHLLLFLDSDEAFDTPERIDEVICAEIPSKTKDLELYEVITKNMIHGPCGDLNPQSPCMKKDVNGRLVCSKKFPKQYTSQTQVLEGGYPLYKRRDFIDADSRYFIRHPSIRSRMQNTQYEVTNQWVVPYNPYLSKKYKAHINVEHCASVHAVKYINKYVYKGSDKTTVKLSDTVNEIDTYLQGRYIGPTEAFWRIFEYPFHEEDPTVVALPLHLPNQQQVVIPASSSREEVQEILDKSTTMLIAFLQYNKTNTDGRKYLYHEFPQHFVYDRSKKAWKPRKRGIAIGRVQYCTPICGERYYLRLLLTAVTGPTSFDHLKTVGSILYPTFKDACVAMHLIEDDKEWSKCFHEASIFSTGKDLRNLFIVALTQGEVVDPNALWREFMNDICDDLDHRLSQLFPNNNFSEDASTTQFYSDKSSVDYGLHLLQKKLNELNHSLDDYNMPKYLYDWDGAFASKKSFCSNQLISTEYEYDTAEQEDQYNKRYSVLNQDQKLAFDTIIASIEDIQENNSCFFLQGPAGTGKTFVYTTICNYFRSKKKIVLCVASSGIAALLLPGGTTSHFRFKIPLQINADSSCYIKKKGHLADLIRKTTLIIWDEVPMQNKFCFEAVDKTLQDIFSNESLFGGLPIIFGGDFAQIPPVIEKGGRAQIVEASVKNSYIWPYVNVLKLKQNMRVRGTSSDDERFKTWLQDLSYNPHYINNKISFPHYIHQTNDIHELIDRVYSKEKLLLSSSDQTVFEDSAILTTRNEVVDDINSRILSMMPGDESIIYSADTADISNSDDTDKDEQLFQASTEYLNTLNPSNFPPHLLKLKIGCVVMLLRNLNPKRGLCNGTRLIVKEVGNYILKVAVLNKNSKEQQIEFIPRIKLSTMEGQLPFILTRKQFPVRLCFAMTMNKSQGQSLSTVGIDLRKPVFTHGQLYVSMSRSIHLKGITVLFNDDNEERRSENVVYPELLN
jgi:hypothetical protein